MRPEKTRTGETRAVASADHGSNSTAIGKISLSTATFIAGHSTKAARVVAPQLNTRSSGITSPIIAKAVEAGNKNPVPISIVMAPFATRNSGTTSQTIVAVKAGSRNPAATHIAPARLTPIVESRTNTSTAKPARAGMKRFVRHRGVARSLESIVIGEILRITARFAMISVGKNVTPGWIPETESKEGSMSREGFTRRLFRVPTRMPIGDTIQTSNAGSKQARTTNVKSDKQANPEGRHLPGGPHINKLIEV